MRHRDAGLSPARNFGKICDTELWHQAAMSEEPRHRGQQSGTGVMISYEARLIRVLDYIHDHPAGDLSLDNLADIAAMSRFHWHRTYHAMAGPWPGWRAIAVIPTCAAFRAPLPITMVPPRSPFASGAICSPRFPIPTTEQNRCFPLKSSPIPPAA